MGAFAKSYQSEWDSLIKDICENIGQLTGNVLTEKQRPMVESRLKRRMLDLRLPGPADYRNHWNSYREDENKFLVGLLTTHFTSFFREFAHFEWLAKELPVIIQQARKEGRTQLKFWSSACSKGQEVWSLCMWLQHHIPRIDPGMQWMVYGSDIDPTSLKEASNAVYHRRELETVPRHLWEGHWSRGTGEIADWYRIKTELRSKAKFFPMNLLAPDLPRNEKFDVILCRNVLIYFNEENLKKVVNNLIDHLSPQGVLITGMSESLTSSGFPLKSVSTSIYRLRTAEVLVLKDHRSVTAPKEEISFPQPLRVLCVDDSGTVLAILKKILREPEYKVIDTAANGQEAMEKFNALKPDVVTLDLHMPVMDGPTFLKTSGIAEKTPVIVVSSVNRDDAAMVNPLFKLGVCDFVEKPTLTNLEKVGEELMQKIKMGWMAKKKKIQLQTSNERASLKKRPAGQIILNFGTADIPNLQQVLKCQRWESDELNFYFSGNLTMEQLKEKLAPQVLYAGKVNYFTDKSPLPTSSHPGLWLHFQGGSEQILKRQKRTNHFVIVEEATRSFTIKELADDLSPSTSFAYLVDKLLAG